LALFIQYLRFALVTLQESHCILQRCYTYLFLAFALDERHLASNYRPVSLTSITCKVMEHIVHSSVMCHFDRNKIKSGTTCASFQSCGTTPVLSAIWYNSVRIGDLASNYRPVSLTSIACKVMEHIVHSSVMGHFDRNKILTNAQHGFCKKRSCESQLITIHDELICHCFQNTRWY
jgi:uncharacterized membrane protein